MRIGFSILTVAAMLSSACTHATEASSKAARSQSQEGLFKAKDGTDTFGDLYHSQTTAKGIVLMFHQADSNSGEYALIAPQVAKLGYDCMAVDLRSGGDMFGVINRTVRAHGGSRSYEEAYQDMQGALSWAKGQRYPKIMIWGSSYSASLCLRLARESTDVNAALAFSPGEYFADDATVRTWAQNDHVPTLMAFTQSELHHVGNDLFGALPGSEKNVLVSFPSGVHGSSTLREDRNRDGYAEYWAATEKFLVANSAP